MAGGALGSGGQEISLDTSIIRNWRSIVTLIVFIITNIVVLFPFHVPIYVPRVVWEGLLRALNTLRIIPPRQSRIQHDDSIEKQPAKSGTPTFVQFNFPLNFVTAPLVADLFLLAILAIGRQEVHDGTIGANNISPLDIMLFFLSLAYIAISLDASGLIRYLAFRVLQWGGDVGHRLFFYLYAFFFGLTSFIGNDPIILSGTAFLAYLTRVSSNIVHPRAWIHSQFAVANIGSAILVSSNPTNLVLARAFDIKFINYTANIIVPVLATGIVLFPFLLYIVFADEALIPESIKMHELPEEVRLRKPVNPNIPHARGQAEEDEKEHANDEPGQLLSLEEIMNPFLDKKGAAFGAILMAVTLITLLALNAATTGTGEHPVFWVTLPAAVVQFVWDVALGWLNRHETREIARKGRESIARAKAEREARAEAERRAALEADDASTKEAHAHEAPQPPSSGTDMSNTNGSFEMSKLDAENRPKAPVSMNGDTKVADEALEAQATPDPTPQQPIKPRASFVSLTRDWYKWAQETFPTATTVLAHLPFALVPFAFCMFVLVQGLVTKGWVQVFAYGWDHWINKTGTIGAIGGMGFLSVILCNFAGTNIGTTILLSRVIQAWQQIHDHNGLPISDRTFWATVYSMALGVNYGAFSAAFSASLAGLLWRDILSRKHIRVRGLDFARVNLPIIAISMVVGCVVLVGEVYIMRGTQAYNKKS